MYIILLAYTTDENSFNLTYNALLSLKHSNYKGEIKSVLIIENSNFEWKFSDDYGFEVESLNLHQEFNYNRFLNLGIKWLNGKYLLKDNDLIACCNNDLIFDKNWLIINHYDYPSMSPKCSLTQSQKHFTKNTKGYRTAIFLAGWAIMLKYSTWLTIGGFDEDFPGWFADDSYAMQLIEHKIEHWLITDSIVNHINGGSNTLKTLDKTKFNEFTINLIQKFNIKYKRNKFNKNPEYQYNETKFN